MCIKSHCKKKAWSNFFNSYIRCVKYISDKEWYFVLNDDVDNRNIRRAGTNYSFFNWFDI